MTVRRDDLRKLRGQIRTILLEDWDPIGVRSEPRAQDEYDSYADTVCRLVMEGHSTAEIASYLSQVEEQELGMSSSADRLLPVASKLSKLNVGA
jgi:hypothetical protein